jgi:DNA-binding GntR family transcriptional regulator
MIGRARPGDHLGEEELAKHLGVSRGTVREAPRHMQQEGLVTAGNRGMLRVNSLSPREVQFWRSHPCRPRVRPTVHPAKGARGRGQLLD